MDGAELCRWMGQKGMSGWGKGYGWMRQNGMEWMDEAESYE